MPVSPFRQTWFWVLLAAISLGCAALSYRYFPRIFPVVALNISMDRSHALAAARALASAEHWGPAGEIREVASFAADDAQAFVELEGGGRPALASLLTDELYSAYAWRVRLFKESEAHQVFVYFRPGGEPYGLEETLRQRAPGAALSPDEARAIAEKAARGDPWRLPLERFKPVETSQVKRPGGRIDHTFVYERPDRKLGAGTIRLRLVVSGDRLTTLRHFIKVPEAFNRRYEDMRSANNGIAAGAAVALVLLYILGGCIGGFLFLLRQRAILWRQPLIAAALVAGGQLAAGINGWPLLWMGYDTALSSGGFITERLVSMLTGCVVLGFVFFLSFLAAEGLSRKAFPHHPQFWRLWSGEAASTVEVLGRTVGGYLLAGIMLLYLVVFYYFALGKLGWWTPSEALTDPDSLAHYWPWLTPLANASQAGIWEEMLFRAVPLAGAALLGNRFGGRKWWIAGAFVLQAVIFASGHANYPGQPAYSRLVELILPSFLFATVYLRFGLLPGIILHFTYDAILMSLPLFAASAGGIGIDRAMVALVGLLPLWVLLWRRFRAGAWAGLPGRLRNEGWQPPAAAAESTVTTAPFGGPAAIPAFTWRLALVLGILGAAGTLAAISFSRLGAPLRIGRGEAIQAARKELDRRGVKLPAGFRADAQPSSRPEVIDRFAWQTAGREGYAALLGRYLPESRWLVRFASFEGDVAERAEEWMVYLTGTGELQRFEHHVPEARAGANLGEAEARTRVHAYLKERWGVDAAVLKEVSATSAKHPARTDWTFVLRDPAVTTLAPGEARLQVELAGEEVADAFRFVFVPEDWERADRALQSNFRTASIVRGIATAVIYLTGIGLALVAWGRRKLPGRPAAAVFAAIFGCMVLGVANRWPATVAGFSTAQPLQLQQVMALVGPLVGALFGGGGVALLCALDLRWVRPSPVDGRHATWLAAAAGLALTAGVGFAQWLRADAAPPWPSPAAAGAYVPVLVAAPAAVMTFFSRAALLVFVFAALDRATGGWQRQRAAGAILALLACAVLQLDGGGTSLGSWLVSGGVSALALFAVYFLLLRHDLTAFPLAIGIASAAGALAHGLTGAYPGEVPATLLAAATTAALGWWSTRWLRKSADGRTASERPAAATSG
ncbi:MAG TPA: CPBP family intramembrane glutamic endopeptidase [Lacunisphaera sp.]|nr:CPBP family intramembrane glutamic endopeptidase [Lacunisphaera sp.]